MKAFVERIPGVGLFELLGSEAYHLIKVRRIEKGDGVELLDGRGGRAKGVVSRVGKKTLTLELTASSQEEAEFPLGIGLAIPMQMSTLSHLLPGLVQCSVTHIYLLQTEFSGRLKKAQALIPKLNLIAQQALKQCGRAWVPSMSCHRLDEELVTSPAWPFNKVFIYHPGGCSWSEVGRELGEKSRIVNLIGPEGGFSDQDMAKLLELTSGVVVGLGDPILKMETAAIGVSFRAAQCHLT